MKKNLIILLIFTTFQIIVCGTERYPWGSIVYPPTPDFNQELTLPILFVQVAKDDGTDPIEVEKYLDREGLSAFFAQGNITLEYLPVVQVNSSEMYDLDNEELDALVTKRMWHEESVQKLLDDNAYAIVYFFNRSCPSFAPNGSDRGGAGYGSQTSNVAQSSFNGVPLLDVGPHIAHEVGHTLGLSHNTHDSTNFMFDRSDVGGLLEYGCTHEQILEMRETVFRLSVLREETVTIKAKRQAMEEENPMSVHIRTDLRFSSDGTVIALTIYGAEPGTRCLIQYSFNSSEWYDSSLSTIRSGEDTKVTGFTEMVGMVDNVPNVPAQYWKYPEPPKGVYGLKSFFLRAVLSAERPN